MDFMFLKPALSAFLSLFIHLLLHFQPDGAVCIRDYQQMRVRFSVHKNVFSSFVSVPRRRRRRGRVSEKESALIKTANTHLIQSLNLPEGDDNKKKSAKEGREKLS